MIADAFQLSGYMAKGDEIIAQRFLFVETNRYPQEILAVCSTIPI